MKDGHIRVLGMDRLSHLFETASSELKARGIALLYDTTVLDFILDTTDWLERQDSLYSVNYHWYDLVGREIEELLLVGQLSEGKAVVVCVAVDESGIAGLSFCVTSIE